MATTTYRDASRGQYGAKHNNGETPNLSLEQLTFGCMQRMADASELMAKNHKDLLRDLELMRSSRDSWRKSAEDAQRSGSALRGVITKKDNRIRELEEELAALAALRKQ